jgi:hypothetical protein
MLAMRSLAAVMFFEEFFPMVLSKMFITSLYRFVAIVPSFYSVLLDHALQCLITVLYKKCCSVKELHHVELVLITAL